MPTLKLEPPVVKDKHGVEAKVGHTVKFEDGITGVIRLGASFPKMPDNFYKEGQTFMYIAIPGIRTNRLIKPKAKYSLEFEVCQP